MEPIHVVDEKLLDVEWARLILEARRFGLSIEEIRNMFVFIRESNTYELSGDEAVV